MFRFSRNRYVLVGNCIYYYHHEADVYPSKVMFLTGSFVEPLQEVANERKGYWGIEISRNHEQVGGWTWTWTWTACRILISRGGSLTELLCVCACMGIIYLLNDTRQSVFTRGVAGK